MKPSRPIIASFYNDAWPASFEDEATLIFAALDPQVLIWDAQQN